MTEQGSGKVVWHQTMSIDGFITGPDDSGGWAFGHGGPSPEVFAELMRTIGATVTGRRSYDIGRKRGAKFYGGHYTGPIFVLTHRPVHDDQPNLTFVSGDIPEIIAKARVAADGGDVIVTGADVARQCVEAGQVDELLVHVVPVLLGAGIRIFDRTGTGWFTLEPVGIARAGNVYDMRYRFIR